MDYAGRTRCGETEDDGMKAYQSPVIEQLTNDPVLAQTLSAYEHILRSGEFGHLQTGPNGLSTLRLPDGRVVYVDRNGNIVNVVG